MKLGHIGLPVKDINIAEKFYDAIAPYVRFFSFAALVFLAGAGCTADFVPVVFEWDDTQEFQLFVRLEHEELSEDANSVTEQVLIEDGHVIYTYDYYGYHPNEDFLADERESFELTDEMHQELLSIIDEYGLDQEVIEKQSIGDGDAVYVVFKLNQSGDRVESNIQAMTFDLGTREANLENVEYVNGVEEVIDLITSLY